MSWGYFFRMFAGISSFGDEYFVRVVLSSSSLYAIICLKPSILYLTELSIYPFVCGKNTEPLFCATKLSTASHNTFFYFYHVMSDLKIVALNVKGFNNVVKRQKVLAFLKKEKTQIALLSETHLNDLEHLKLRRSWVGQVFYSSYNTNSRGVAILIHHSLPFTLETTIKDNDGRYVLISGYLYGEQILIGCIYGPNSYDSAFFPKLLSEVSSVSTPYVVLGGDFNCVSDPSVDQSPSKSNPASRKSLRLKEFCHDLELFDTWRIINPRGRDYTFFSNPHQTSSRIDFFLSSRMVLDRVRECSIGICSLSDHSHVSLSIRPPNTDPSSRHWRLNPSLLSSPPFIDYITEQWNVLIAANKTPDISPSLLWETAKAYLRGSIISYTTAQKKAAMKEQLSLENTIQQLEVQFKGAPSRILFKKLEAACSALNQLLTRKAESAIFFAKHRLYESGNKPGHLLARLARGRMETNTIPSLLDDNQVRHYKTKDINTIMRQFYQKLYSSECELSEGRRKEFFNRVSLPSLSEEKREKLNLPVTEEVRAAIASLKGGKAPGPDGFCPEFYKKLSHLIAGPLTDMFSDSFKICHLPPTLNVANITLILKKDKPPDICGSFRPISLIGVDSKLLSKLLATRLEKFLPSLINPDQTGFIQNRLSLTNVRRLLNVIQYSNQANYRGLAVSLDAEKAFDRVE